jgi:hypothetical protein
MSKKPTVTIKEPLCIACIYLLDCWECIAFPGGIPVDIISGTFDHREPWPKSEEYPSGDWGTQFKPV